ncbi:MAG: ParB/RepB/Spo0J family partition protein [Bacteroidales bacterium]|jgi:ParB family chromosome partitioning protein|nr:ParB/RepB/Spo0J family partition protein [Bacteroidales bacterium]
MAKRNALGRGLGALIDDSGMEHIVTADSINEINIDKIEANPFQPRTVFNEESLEELAKSIRELGIIQPITVRNLNDNKFQLISGERRLRAAHLAGLKKIPAFIRFADDQGMLEMALVENIQREDLDSIEVAISYQRLMEECKLTQESLSERVGKKRSTISNYLRLLKLPAEIQLGIRDKQISMGHARALVNFDNDKTQLKIYYKIIDEGLSVRKTEDIIRDINTPKSKGKKEKVRLPEEYLQLKKHLVEHFNSDIDFNRNNKGSGKIVISFKSDEDLERIMGIIDKMK